MQDPENNIARQRVVGGLILAGVLALASGPAWAGAREQAKRIHDRLAGVPPSASVLNQMETDITSGQAEDAAYLAMENHNFYDVTLKNFVTPWTNRDQTVFAPLNDFTATVIGMVRDDIPFTQVLWADILYVGDSSLGLPAYSVSNNDHYEALENQGIDLKANLVKTTQSTVAGLPASATSGVITTRAAAKSFFKAGTNRAMFRYTMINFLCKDLQEIKDITRPTDRIRQDVTRSPGGDSRIFLNNCVGCHSGMDPMVQAYAYYDYKFDETLDPDGEKGRLFYNAPGTTDPATGTRVMEKYLIHTDNFKYGYITTDDHWDNYWRSGPNAVLGWSSGLTGSGTGAKSLGQELASSEAFAQCQVKKVFKAVCLRSPQDSSDRSEVVTMVANFKASNYQMKRVFADAAVYCMGN